MLSHPPEPNMQKTNVKDFAPPSSLLAPDLFLQKLFLPTQQDSPSSYQRSGTRGAGTLKGLPAPEEFTVSMKRSTKGCRTGFDPFGPLPPCSP